MNSIPNILFLGYKNYDELGSIINASDVCLAVYTKSSQYNPGYYAVESVWKVGEYALFDKPIIGQNMVPSKELINANENNLVKKMIEALESEIRLTPKTWMESEKKLLKAYERLDDRT